MSKEPKQKKAPGKAGKIVKTVLSSVVIILFVQAGLEDARHVP